MAGCCRYHIAGVLRERKSDGRLLGYICLINCCHCVQFKASERARRSRRKVNGGQTDVRVRHLLRVPGYSTNCEPLASEPPQFMLKYVDSTVLSAAFVCLVTLYASERAVPEYQYPGGLHVKQG
jgi:hypothetical protein